MSRASSTQQVFEGEKIAFLKNIPIKIPSDLVLSRLKYAKHKTKADSKILSFISDVIDEGYSLVEAKAVYEIFNVRIIGDRIKLAERAFTIKSRSLAKHLDGASKMALFVCTIGNDLPDKVDEYVERTQIARAAILDAVGSEAAEALAEKVDDLIAKKANGSGYSTVMRFSPGYGDWTIFDQKKILKILKAERIGVKITKSCIMIPEKSVTACIGMVKRSSRPIRKVYEGHTKSSKR